MATTENVEGARRNYLRKNVLACLLKMPYGKVLMHGSGKIAR